MQTEGKSRRLLRIHRDDNVLIVVTPIKPGDRDLIDGQEVAFTQTVAIGHKVAARDIKAGENPDGAVYDPFSKTVFVMNHDSGESTVIDPVARKAVATIPVGGTLEFPASDGAGKVFAVYWPPNRIGFR